MFPIGTIEKDRFKPRAIRMHINNLKGKILKSEDGFFSLSLSFKKLKSYGILFYAKKISGSSEPAREAVA